MGNKLLYSKPKGSSKNEIKNVKHRGSFLVETFRRSASLRRMSWMPRPHLDCRAWLTQLELPQYADCFSRFGGVEEFLYYDEKRIRDNVGIKISSHRARIMTSLNSLKDKYERNQKLKVDPCPRTSLIEGEEKRNLKIKLDISPEVVLRNGTKTRRQDSERREAAIIGSPEFERLSFKMDATLQSESGEEELKRLLETELALDVSDLRSHAWYHGSISRERAEEVVVEDGNFIIRDCISQPGDFVLTCKWNSQVIHVIIQKSVLQPNTIYERIHYKLEDETYDTIPDLVTAYVGSRKPITFQSGARISIPINRNAPLSFYVSKYAAQAEYTRLHGTLSRPPTNEPSLSCGPKAHPNDLTDSSGNEVGEAQLKRLLETELALDDTDLRSHAWYHGSISRERAEEVVTEDGNFIIRDCISQPGDFVLTCKWNSQTIHVIVQKFIYLPNTIYERIQYKLEEDTYDTIPDLVTAYVGSKKPVTFLSGARIATPVNRTAPLSFYVSKYAAQAEHTRLHGTLTRPSSKTPPHRTAPHLRAPVAVGCSFVRVSNSSPPRMRREAVPSMRFQRPSSGGFEERLTSSGDGVMDARGPCEVSSQGTNGTFSSHSLPRHFQSSALSLPVSQPPSSDPIQRRPDGARNNAHFTPSTKPVQETHREVLSSSESFLPPPKPSRVPSFKVNPHRPTIGAGGSHGGERVYAEIEEEEDDDSPRPQEKEDDKTRLHGDGDRKLEEKEASATANETSCSIRHSRLSEVYQPSGSDSGNGSGDSVQTSTSDYRNRDSQISFGDSGYLIAEDDSLAEEENLLVLPEIYPTSAFDLDNFSTLLLPAIENRPLDATAFKGIKNTLTESGSRILAAHLTKIDLEVLNGSPEKDYGLGVTMGVEMVTLPQGSQLRRDLIERTECLKLLVVISIVKLEDLSERADMIFRWIQIAIDTKTAMGNLYGFTGIMLGLCSPEVQKLTQTWHTLRQKHTDSAFKFESKLRSNLKAMNECANPQAPNTIIPHLLPYVLLCERDLEDIYSLHTKAGSLFQWESSSSDYGLQMMYHHLQEGRTFTQNLNLYKRNAELLLGDMNHMEELTLDMFRTEFHLKFLFGSKAAYADSEQRVPKFQKVIATLSEYCEPTV